MTMIEVFRISVGPSSTLAYEHPLPDSASENDFSAKNIALINTTPVPATVYIGGTNAVTPADGARWIPEAGRTLSLNLEPGESIYLVCDDSQFIDVMVNGR